MTRRPARCKPHEPCALYTQRHASWALCTAHTAACLMGAVHCTHSGMPHEHCALHTQRHASWALCTAHTAARLSSERAVLHVNLCRQQAQQLV
eukprot:1156520-Pelagomonas_calceolata.AAC.9